MIADRGVGSRAGLTPGAPQGPYRALFGQPVLRGLAVADVCARLPQGMVSITLLLVAAQHASIAVAGLVVAGYTLGQALTAPLRGRLADRRGLVPVAALCAAGYALGLVALLLSALASAPAVVLIGAASAAGLLNPPLSPGMRSLWSAYTSDRLRQTAFALDAAVFDLAYIVGPVLASTLATALAPAVAVVVLLALTATAVLIISTRRPRTPATPATPATPEAPVRPATPAHQGTPSHAPDRHPQSRPHSPLRSPALRRLLVTAALTNAALSATEVALTAYVRHHHALWASGPLLAEVSIGSILGSLLLGARTFAAKSRYSRLPWLLAGYALGLTVLAAAGLYAPLLAVAAPLAGLCLGPTLATLFGTAAGTAPAGSGTETQAWINSIMNGGAAGGAALAGFSAGQPVLALALAAATAAAAALSAVVQGHKDVGR
jgi:MFS family permease